MPPEGYHVVRSHIRRNPRPSAKKMSGWTITGIIGVVLLWGHFIGFTDSSTTAPVKPAAPTSAAAAH